MEKHVSAGSARWVAKRTKAGRSLPTLLRFAPIWLVVAVATRVAEVPRPLEVPVLYGATAEFAGREKIATSGIEFAPAGAQPRQGDTVTLLVTLAEGGTQRQWLATIAAAGLTEKERALPAPKEDVLYTSTGLTLRYPKTRTALRVTFAGPFFEDPAKQGEPDIARERVVVAPEYLSLGLDRYAEAAQRWSEQAHTAGVKLADLFYIGSGGKLSAEQLEKGKRFTTLIHPPPEEERLVVGVSFALREFLRSALEVDAFKDVLFQVMVKPSLWSLVTGFGANAFLQYDQEDVRPVDGRALGLASPAYALPLKLHFNGKLALRATLVMTEARPPLQASAGIVAIASEHPTEAGKKLLIQMIAARVAR